jgi:hypothetical protein
LVMWARSTMSWAAASIGSSARSSGSRAADRRPRRARPKQKGQEGLRPSSPTTSRRLHETALAVDGHGGPMTTGAQTCP